MPRIPTSMQYVGSTVRDWPAVTGVCGVQGDSGGPLVRRSGGTFTLVGLVSSGVGCARPGLPGIYTDVYHYRGWVLRNVR